MRKWLFVTLLPLASAAWGAERPIAELVLGSWDLEKFVIVEGGEETHFCGKGGTFSGMILYEATGGMSVGINCGTLGTGKVPAAAYGGMLFYSGSYTLKGNDLHHRIKNASFPKLIGQTQVRPVESVDDDTLVLGGKFGTGTIRIEWRRVRAP